MNLETLDKILEDQPGFRKKQALKFIFQDLGGDWDDATIFSKETRQKLKEKLSLKIDFEILWAKNKNSAKALVRLEDGVSIEAVLMKGEKRNTVCVSSQAGCPLGCVFCATGKKGFVRNLEYWEIVQQVLIFARILKKDFKVESVTNGVFMGMGEPFLNYENVMKEANFINSKEGFEIAARKISISTAGIIPGIMKFSEENKQFNLAVSLHAPDNKIREKLMKINKEYPIEKLFNAIEFYIEKTNRKVMLEYSLFEGVNDGEECAQELSRLIKKKQFFIVNLIEYNEYDFCDEGGVVLKKSDKMRTDAFKEILEKNNIEFSERFRFGRDIYGACGQLASRLE
ncbi:MAG: 23S rRNA (adenine(2503)-C(2))-methyltransferase RlmN [Patescibacteria group bacterium]|jgi:23S rRNA (adenine2503-C2)-methyltransferase|nr:23S rRNA (adenine(2503)-C(2))-methyltransferase RlmN [Patescibacteria group bacterium]